jgi:hypothetical protein
MATAVGGKSRGRSERGRSEAVALMRAVLRVTAVHPASCCQLSDGVAQLVFTHEGSCAICVK